MQTDLNQIQDNKPVLRLNVKVSPNPCQGNFKIEGDDLIRQCVVTVRNILGKPVFYVERPLQLPILVDITGSPAGVYFISAECDTGFYYGKIELM